MMNIRLTHNKILIISFLVFLFIYNFTNIFVWWPMLKDTEHLIFNWPDSTANYFFSSLFANGGNLWFSEMLNLYTDNLLHARSINVVGGNLVPMTFLPAIVIFGAFGRILGEFGILALTPFLAALSGLLVYRLVYYIFKDLDIALASSLLFWSLAPWVFFANEVMLPSILFIFLVLAGFWALAKSIILEKSLYWILASLFLSLAIFVRPTEVVWLSLIFIFIVYLNRQKIYLKHYVYGFVIFLAVLFLFLILNKNTYGSYFSIGYLNFQSNSLSTEFSGQKTSGLLNYLKLLIAPFGLDFILLTKNFYKYFIEIFAPYLVLAFLGVSIIFYKKQVTSPWKKYFLLSPFVFIIILLYYGSWDLADPLVKELNKISISYVRYFLPLYIWVLPLAAWAIKKMFYGPTKINKVAYYIVIVALMLTSVKLAFYSKNDGLWSNMDNLKNYNEQYKAVSQVVEDGAVIISERSDKVFFPKYRVIVPQGDLPLWSRVKNIINLVPIYYYTDKNSELLSVDQGELDKLNLKLEDQGKIWHNFS